MLDLDDIQVFTDAQIVLVLRKCLVNAALAEHYSIAGKQLSRDPAKIQALIEKYEARIIDAAGGGYGGTVLGVFGETQ